MRRRDPFADSSGVGADRRPAHLRDRAHGAAEERRLGDDVRRRAGHHLGDRDDRWIEGVDAPGHHRLEGQHDLGGHGDRVEGGMRRGGVSAAAADGDSQRVGRRQHRTRADIDRARFEEGRDVERECGARPLASRSVEEALLEHEPRTVEALLARLEHQQDPAGPHSAPVDEEPRRAKQHRDMGVVSARVHPTVVLGREFETGLLGQRQRVHVGAQEDRGAWTCAFDHGHDRPERDARDRVESEGPDGLHDDALRLGQREPHLRYPMQQTPLRDHLGEDLARGAEADGRADQRSASPEYGTAARCGRA